MNYCEKCSTCFWLMTDEEMEIDDGADYVLYDYCSHDPAGDLDEGCGSYETYEEVKKRETK